MTLAAICQRFGLSWSEAKQLRLHEFNALVDFMSEEQEQQRRSVERPGMRRVM